MGGNEFVAASDAIVADTERVLGAMAVGDLSERVDLVGKEGFFASSAEAAKEIKNLIGDSAEKVSEGSRLADQTGEALSEIVTSAGKVDDIITEISTARNWTRTR